MQTHHQGIGLKKRPISVSLIISIIIIWTLLIIGLIPNTLIWHDTTTGFAYAMASMGTIILIISLGLTIDDGI